jgi:hypothetical protein
MGDFSSFIEHVLLNYWTVLAGVLIAVEPVTQMLWSGYDDWAAKWLTKSRRIRIGRWAALVAFVIANYMAFHDAKEEAREARAGAPIETARHLMPDQKTRLKAALRLNADEHGYLVFNSVINCDECEDYAEELREFVASIPGWRSDGGTLNMAGESIPRYGLKLFSANSGIKDHIKIIINAFQSASIPLTQGDPENYDPSFKMDAIIVVGRREK